MSAASLVAALPVIAALPAIAALLIAAASPAEASAEGDRYAIPFPIGVGYTVLGGDLAKMFPGSYATVHYAFGGAWDYFGFDVGVRMVFLQQPDDSPWASAPIYGAIGPGFFFDIPLSDDRVWNLTLRSAVNIAWIGVMYESAGADADTDADAHPHYDERVLLSGPSVEVSARLSYAFTGYGMRVFTEVSSEWAALQNGRRGRYADGYLLHMTAGFAMGYDLFSF